MKKVQYSYKFITILVVLSIWISLKGGLPEAVAQVNFPDPNLDAAVRSTLGLGETDPNANV